MTLPGQHQCRHDGSRNSDKGVEVRTLGLVYGGSLSATMDGEHLIQECEMTYPTDHAGLEVLPFNTCLELLTSVPVGRIGFFAGGELVILPVNHLVDGQDVVFRTATGSKLSAAENGDQVAFEADSYDDLDRSGWSVVVNGFAEVIDDDAETGRLSSLGLHPWSAAVEHPCWIRIRPVSVSGRRTPGA
jgi:uncharacterized protein